MARKSKEADREYQKRYFQEHKKELMEKRKLQKVGEVKERYKEYHKEYRKENKERLKDYDSKYYEEHKLQRKEYNRKYYLEHKKSATSNEPRDIIKLQEKGD